MIRRLNSSIKTSYHDTQAFLAEAYVPKTTAEKFGLPSRGGVIDVDDNSTNHKGKIRRPKMQQFVWYAASRTERQVAAEGGRGFSARERSMLNSYISRYSSSSSSSSSKANLRVRARARPRSTVVALLRSWSRRGKIFPQRRRDRKRIRDKERGSALTSAKITINNFARQEICR